MMCSKRVSIPTNRYGSYVTTNENAEYTIPTDGIQLPSKPLFASAPRSSKVVVATSTLPNAGKGLFAKTHILENHRFAFYNGIRKKAQDVNDADLLDNKAVYLDTNNDILIFGSPECEGYYANDPLDDNRCNCKIVCANGSYTLQATRNIEPNEELFLAYGADYWSRYSTPELQDKILCNYPHALIEGVTDDYDDILYLNVMKAKMHEQLPRTQTRSAVCRPVRIEALDCTRIVDKCTYDTGASTANYIGSAALEALEVYDKLVIEQCNHRVKLGDSRTILHLERKVTIRIRRRPQPNTH